MNFQSSPTADSRRLQIPQRDRRAQPPLSGNPGGQTLEGQGRDGRAGGPEQLLPGGGVHPQRQRAGLHRQSPTGLAQGQRDNQHGPHRARIPVGERLCGVLQ